MLLKSILKHQMGLGSLLSLALLHKVEPEVVLSWLAGTLVSRIDFKFLTIVHVTNVKHRLWEQVISNACMLRNWIKWQFLDNVHMTFRKLEGRWKPEVNRAIAELLQKDHYSDTRAHIFINIEMSMVFLA